MEAILDAEELTVLLEAMEAWVNKDAAGEILGDVVTSLVSKNQEEAKAIRQECRQKADTARALRKERAILIQAKLIRMKDEKVAASITKEPDVSDTA